MSIVLDLFFQIGQSEISLGAISREFIDSSRLIQGKCDSGAFSYRFMCLMFFLLKIFS